MFTILEKKEKQKKRRNCAACKIFLLDGDGGGRLGGLHHTAGNPGVVIKGMEVVVIVGAIKDNGLTDDILRSETVRDETHLCLAAAA